MHKKRVRKNFQGSHKLPQAYEKCAMKMKVELEEKRWVAKIFLMERKSGKTCAMDIK